MLNSVIQLSHGHKKHIVEKGYTAFRCFLGRDYFSFNCLFNEIKLISSIRRFKIYIYAVVLLLDLVVDIAVRK